jgi:hypothetical protein
MVTVSITVDETREVSLQVEPETAWELPVGALSEGPATTTAEALAGGFKVLQAVGEASLPPAVPVEVGPGGTEVEIESVSPVWIVLERTLLDGTGVVMTKPEGTRLVLDTPVGVEDGKLEREADGTGAPGMLQPVNHFVIMS